MSALPFESSERSTNPNHRRAGAWMGVLACSSTLFALPLRSGAGAAEVDATEPAPPLSYEAAPDAHRETTPTHDVPDDDGGAQERDPENGDDNELVDLSLEELMNVQVVVSASRREEPLNLVPYAMSVITAADIRSAGARSVPDALRLVVGVDVAALSSGQTAVSPRGFHGFLTRQVLVLVDGRQIFDSHFGGTLWGSWPFALEDIARIEVIRGPAGVAWGPNAVNGVINIITHDPRDQLGTTLKLSGASRGTYKAYVGHATESGHWRVRLSTEYERSDGFPEGGSILGPPDDELLGGRINLHAVHECKGCGTLTLSAGSGVLNEGFPRTPLAGFGQRHTPRTTTAYLLGRWVDSPEPDSQVEVIGYVNDFSGSPGIPQIDYRYQQLALQLRKTRKIGDTHTLTIGADGRADLLDASNAAPRMLERDHLNTGTIGFYLQDDWRFAPSWSLGMGIRLDYEFYGGFQPSARLSLARQFADGSFAYGAVSRAVQMPPVGLRFLNLPVLNGLVWTSADRGVDPETLLAYELGYRRRFFGKIETSVTAFWHEYDDLTTLSPRLGPPGLINFHFGNHASASLYGVEFEARYPVTDRLTLLGNYDYEVLAWRAQVPFHDKDLITPPKNKASLGVRYSPTDDVHLSGTAFYVDAVHAPNASFPFLARRVDPYIRLDLRAAFDFRNDDATFAVGVRDLLDNNHGEGGTIFLDYTEVPRMVYAELRIHIRPLGTRGSKHQ